MSSAKVIALPTCTSCNRSITPEEKAVRFPCPSCNRVTIWRCEVCRDLSRTYVCPVCGFEGP
ncbi:MAG: zinc finger domain-containing protein [Aigarchaeota archaeon]|nr:zinc finger domain-containing protein [Aigarchaeota archaeon]